MNKESYRRSGFFERFCPALYPPEPLHEKQRFFAFCGKEILLTERDGRLTVPDAAAFVRNVISSSEPQYIGELDNESCFCMETLQKEPPAGMRFVTIRSIAAMPNGEEAFRVAGYAYHLMNWNRLNRFCGRCGAPMENKSDERAKICPHCKNVVYPRISPAVIIAITKGDQILLAHNRGFKDGMYSVISGFTEPGETLEDCTKREISEEIGIEIQNLCYFGSQPWPFPDSLMVAFTAEYKSGILHPDGIELADAGWFSRFTLPNIPGTESIAGRMIRWTIEKINSTSD